ncbi:hypothetical protein HAZT_HAZT003918 [Hyalella azteca]|uniref:Ig-like domain-containing protein n=1 Tax=Hyalella azteca TaxID=294128 RepID=A0A6A0H7D1_HYAAZ|nr:hypothetical protein HAZT_HAZT003918 [Hyalella azteca]
MFPPPVTSKTIKISPTCAGDQTRVYGAAREETITVSCRLEASPPVVAFSWRFNSSGDVVDLKDEYVASDGLSSLLQYTVKSELDYGTLLCWGSNILGMQQEPCVFRVVPAEPPDAPENCTFRNHPNETFSVICEPGYDGGLKQEFVAEVIDMRTRRLLLNITETTTPYFQLVGIAGETSFVVRIYAKNSKGRSAMKIMRGYTDRDSTERHIAPVMGQPSANNFSDVPIAQILGCVVGVLGSLVLIALVAVLVVRLKKDKKRPSKTKVAAAGTKNEDPDLIPNRGWCILA